LPHPYQVNPLELLNDPSVSDILIEGDKEILVDRSNQLEKTGLRFNSIEECLSFAKALTEGSNVRFDLGNPFAEINQKTEFGKLRIHMLLAGECSANTIISIRRHPEHQFSLCNLVDSGFITQNHFQQLQQIMSAKKNFVIIGATGTGKTTLLKAMLNESSQERIISIEDSQELNLMGNAVSLFTRAANQEGVGEITISDLLRQALRMRPDRIVLGEARGDELKVLLSALNTGHQGSGFTLHANGFDELMPRLMTMMALGGLSRRVSEGMIHSSLDYCIEVKREQGNRRVVGITSLGTTHV